VKNNIKTISQKIFLGTVITGVVLSSGVGVTQAETLTNSSISQTEQTTKYSSKVMETVRLSLGVKKHSTEVDNQINAMKKVEVMDIYMDSFGEKVKGKEVRKVVNEVFGADLNTISKMNYGSKLSSYTLPIMKDIRVSLNVAPDSTELDAKIMKMPKSEVMDRYIKVNDYSLTNNEIRILINDIFGVNLNGISGLEGAQLSIYSKGQWIIQSEKDLFKISSSLDDVSLYIESTDYLEKQTGSSEFPDSLAQKLINLGFTYAEVSGNYTYTHPTGESVPDALKTQTIGTVIQAIQEINANQ